MLTLRYQKSDQISCMNIAAKIALWESLFNVQSSTRRSSFDNTNKKYLKHQYWTLAVCWLVLGEPKKTETGGLGPGQRRFERCSNKLHNWWSGASVAKKLYSSLNIESSMNARMEKFNFVCLQLVKYLSTPVVERWISQLQTLPGEKQVDRYLPNFFLLFPSLRERELMRRRAE